MTEIERLQAEIATLHQEHTAMRARNERLENMKPIGFLVHNSIFITKRDIAYAWDDDAKELYVKEE